MYKLSVNVFYKPMFNTYKLTIKTKIQGAQLVEGGGGGFWRKRVRTKLSKWLTSSLNCRCSSKSEACSSFEMCSLRQA